MEENWPYIFRVGHKTILFRRGSSTEWAEVNPVLGLHEPGFDLTERKIKRGDGITPWSQLPWFAAIL